jgi:hypothetical protein
LESFTKGGPRRSLRQSISVSRETRNKRPTSKVVNSRAESGIRSSNFSAKTFWMLRFTSRPPSLLQMPSQATDDFAQDADSFQHSEFRARALANEIIAPLLFGRRLL